MTDRGSVNFNVALDQGVIQVSVRPPLGLESTTVTADIPIPDLLDLFADLLKGLNAVQRDALEAIRRGVKPRGTEIHPVRVQ